MEADDHHIILACVVSGTLFSLLGVASFSILWAVNWRPWRIYSWIFARKWPDFLQGPQLGLLCGFLSLSAWMVVLSPVVVLIVWGCWLILILGRDIIGLAVIMAGTALLLAFYAIMLWWRTQWQSSRAVAVLLLLAVALLCAYELCAVYVTAGSSASERYSPSGFFFGVSAIALAINMLFICRMVFNGNGLDVDEYVRRAYRFAYSDCIEAGPLACLPEPPDPNELYPRQSRRASHLGLLYLGSLMVLLVYSILYGLTAKDARWLGTITSAAVIILDWNMGACLYGFQLLKSRVAALFVAGASRVFLICFGVHYWYLGHCVSYAIVASVLLGAAVSRHLSVTNPLAARRDALKSTVIRLREGFRRKEPNSSSSSSEGCASSVKRSSSAEVGHLGNGAATSWNNVEGINSDKSIDSGRPSLALHSSSCHSVAQELEIGTSYVDRNFEHNGSLVVCSSSGLESQGCESSASTSANQQVLDNLALVFQEKLNDPRITSLLKKRARQGDIELSTLLHDKGLDPNFAMMLKEKGLDPTILALLQRSSLDADRDRHDETDITIIDSNSVDNALPNQISLSEELRLRGLEKWLQFSRMVLHHIAGTPERAWVLFSFMFIIETVVVAIFRPKTINVINATHQQFEFGLAVLLLCPVVCSIMAFLLSLKAEEMVMTSKPRKYGFVAWLLSTCVGLLLSFLSKSSLLLGLSLTVPLMVACLSIAVPIWIRNGYQFWVSRIDGVCHGGNHQTLGMKEGVVLFICMSLFTGSVLALGAIVSAAPLDDLAYKGWSGDHHSVTSPYASSVYLGWAMASAIALVVTGVLPIVSWFATYRFSLSSAICVGIFSVVLVGFCGASYLEVVGSREDNVPAKADFLAALLPLVCIPALLSLCSGLLKWKDENWKLSRGVYVFIIIGLLLLLCAISAVIIIVKPWTIGAAFLLVLLLIVLAIGVIHYWASNNFYLTRMQMFFVCFLAFLLALAAFLVGWFEHKPFVGASVGYFSFLFLLAGRALTVLLSPPIVVYSPRVLPVYVYDAHADCGKNVSAAFLVLYGIALATEGWGVVASLKIYPPFAGAAVSAITLVAAFGFAVSRPCLTLKMMEDAVHFLSKETIVQAIARSANKTRNAISGTYSAPQRSASSAALLVGDPTAMRDRAGNFVLPRADVTKLRDRLRNEELAAGSFFCRIIRKGRMLRHESNSDVGHRREMCAHARILALEEAIDTEWVYMWDKFGGYLLLLLGLTAKAERVQDEVRLRLFLDSIGFSDLSAKKIKKWMPEDRRQFEIIQESYIREKEMEEEILMQRREEEGRGKERRKALLEREERKWKEIEASLISSIPNAGNREAAAMAAAVRAVGGDSVLDDSFARERVSSIARRIRAAQLSRRALQGEWVPVVIDDWIPCESPGKPAFATSRKGNELWVSILEKAYAKLHGSYEALEGGLVQDALVDLTGGAGEEIDMRSAQAQIDLASGRLWSQLLRFKQEGFLLGAGSPSGSDVHISSSGIVQGHAYSLLQVREVDGHKLVQIRNPWANEVEWNGPWSDSSPEWTDRMKHKLKHVPQSKDGIFWMSWQDFQIHFRSIYVCRVYPPEMRYSVHGQWRGYSAGGCQDYDTWHQNPQFRIRATGPHASFPIHVFITLTQGVSFSRTSAGFRNYQSSHDSLMFYIGMRILKTRGRRAAYNIYMHESVGGTDYVNSREISCEMVLEPDPKGYTIVPTTIHPGEEAPFVLSVFTKASISLEAL
ncbi:Calpain-type cysteine protease dek1 [Sarracenia purpurea var. burkii]